MLKALLVGTIIFSSFACGNSRATELVITAVSSQFTNVSPSAGSGTKYLVHYRVDSGAVKVEREGDPGSFTTTTASEQTRKTLNDSIKSLDLETLPPSYASEGGASATDGTPMTLVFSTLSNDHNLLIDTANIAGLPAAVQTIYKTFISLQF